jgi:preprotein translocase subunit SecY
MGDKVLTWIKGRASFGAACVLGVLTTLTDFVSQILSFAVDGILQLLLIVVVYNLMRKKDEKSS